MTKYKSFNKEWNVERESRGTGEELLGRLKSWNSPKFEIFRVLSWWSQSEKKWDKLVATRERQATRKIEKSLFKPNVSHILCMQVNLFTGEDLSGSPRVLYHGTKSIPILNIKRKIKIISNDNEETYYFYCCLSRTIKSGLGFGETTKVTLGWRRCLWSAFIVCQSRHTPLRWQWHVSSTFLRVKSSTANKPKGDK